MEGVGRVMEEAIDDGNILLELASNETSLLGLIRTLLSPKTLPHLALIILLSTLLYWIANLGIAGDLAALGFISLSFGYGLTAILSTNQRVKSWITLADDSEATESINTVTRIALSFKICIFPLGVSVFIGLLIMAVFSQESLMDLPSAFPIGLGTLFVLWAVAQGRSFGSWASSVAAKKLPESKIASGSIKVMTAIQVSVISTMSIIGIIAFQFLYEKKVDAMDAIISNIGFFILAITVYGLTVAWTWKLREMALRDKALKKFTFRWTMFAHVFVTWHLLTVWRQLVMSPGTTEVFIEEVLLMMFTVFMAIWSITSRTVKTKFRFVSTENALPWGLSFGYAYAGSVAMLATAFEDITYVMVTGHIIALLTITWIQRSVLIRILNQHDFEVTTVRSAKQNESSPQISTESEESTSPSTEEAVALDDGIDVQWDGAVGPSIGDDIEWNDVIELND
tara:strand:+ start:2039 stop:3400 length:1362 start_codon:yes stop_codon:yes gene_type:complete